MEYENETGFCPGVDNVEEVGGMMEESSSCVEGSVLPAAVVVNVDLVEEDVVVVEVTESVMDNEDDSGSCLGVDEVEEVCGVMEDASCCVNVSVSPAAVVVKVVLVEEDVTGVEVTESSMEYENETGSCPGVENVEEVGGMMEESSS